MMKLRYFRNYEAEPERLTVMRLRYCRTVTETETETKRRRDSETEGLRLRLRE